jgi:hypothetical protein
MTECGMLTTLCDSNTYCCRFDQARLGAGGDCGNEDRGNAGRGVAAGGCTGVAFPMPSDGTGDVGDASVSGASGANDFGVEGPGTARGAGGGAIDFGVAGPGTAVGGGAGGGGGGAIDAAMASAVPGHLRSSCHLPPFFQSALDHVLPPFFQSALDHVLPPQPAAAPQELLLQDDDAFLHHRPKRTKLWLGTHYMCISTG